jgi:hypothetical protein
LRLRRIRESALAASAFFLGLELVRILILHFYPSILPRLFSLTPASRCVVFISCFAISLVEVGPASKLPSASPPLNSQLLEMLMNHSHDSLIFHPFTFVSELVRRQRQRYEIPFVIARLESQLLSEQHTAREIGLCFRWKVAVNEEGKRYLRMLCAGQMVQSA